MTVVSTPAWSRDFATCRMSCASHLHARKNIRYRDPSPWRRNLRSLRWVVSERPSGGESKRNGGATAAMVTSAMASPSPACRRRLTLQQ